MSKDTIYREDAIKAIEDRRCWLTLASQRGDMGHVLWDEYYIKFEDVIDALLLIPSADRPQGKWFINDAGDAQCSICGEVENAFIYGTENWYGRGESHFCPSCGASMTEREGE